MNMDRCGDARVSFEQICSDVGVRTET